MFVTEIKQSHSPQHFEADGEDGIYVVQEDVQEYEVQNAEEFLLEVQNKAKTGVRKEVRF